jgi:hypothetical protein
VIEEQIGFDARTIAPTMTDTEADTVLAWLAEGARVSVPFDAPLFSDNTPYGSSLRRQADGRYVLETDFKEWQVIREEEPMQLSRVTLTELDLRARLRGAPFAQCRRQ